MFPIFFVLLALVQGDQDLCYTAPSKICGRPLNHYEDIPSNPDELHALCPRAMKQLECLHSYDVACERFDQYKGIKPPQQYSRIKATLNDACTEESVLHRVLAVNADCIKARVRYAESTCSKLTRNVALAYERYVNRHPGTKKLLQGAKYWKFCLQDVHTAGCILDDIKAECGYPAYQGVMSVLSEIQILFSSCDSRVFLEFVRLADIVKLEGRSRSILKTYLSDN